MVKKSKNIVVAEDDADGRRLILDTLKYVGHQVQGAKDGQEALELILRDANINMLITDIKMPKMDGYELIDALYVKKYRFPIIVCSAGCDLKRIQYEGTVEFISKPYDYNQLLKMVRTAK